MTGSAIENAPGADWTPLSLPATPVAIYAAFTAEHGL